MKKLASALSVLVLLATMTLGFSSCQQQNQPSQPTQTDPTKTEDPTQTEEPTIVGEWKVLFQDMGDGEIYPGQGMTFIFSKDNTIILSFADGIQKGTYTLVGKSLIIDWGDGPTKATIKELTKNSLIFRAEMGGGEYIEFTCQRITEDPTQTEEASIVGEWKVLYMNLDGDQYPGQGMSFTFLENGTFLLSMEDGLYKGSYTLAGKNLIMETEGEGGIGKFTIKELTKDSLVLISGDGSIEYVCKRVS